MATKARDPGNDFNTLDAAGNDGPRGLWSDGSTMWVVDITDDKIYAYDMGTKARKSSEDFNTLYRINEDGEFPDARPFGIWSDGDTCGWLMQMMLPYTPTTWTPRAGSPPRTSLACTRIINSPPAYGGTTP